MTHSDGEETSALLGRLPGTRRLDLELVSAEMLTARTRRLRFGAQGLETLEAFPGQDLMLDVPAPGRTRFRRRYTMRRLERDASAVVLEVLLHGEGPGSRWASTVSVGDHVEAVGPRGKIRVADDARHHLFCGDESAIPAVFTMVEALPAGASATCLLEVSGPEDELEPPSTRCKLTLRWLRRSGAPGTDGVLERALGELPIPGDGDGDDGRGHGHAYLFGELHQVAAQRTALIERGVAPERIDHKAYWRLGVGNAANGEPERRSARPS